jgi:hypothetical protein
MTCNKVFLGTQWDPIGFYIVQYNYCCIVKFLKIVKYDVDDLNHPHHILQLHVIYFSSYGPDDGHNIDRKV